MIFIRNWRMPSILFNSSRVVFAPVFLRACSGEFAEAEVGEAVESACVSDYGDGMIHHDEEPGCMADADLVEAGEDSAQRVC